MAFGRQTLPFVQALSDTVSDRATAKTLFLNIESTARLTVSMNLSPIYRIVILCDAGLKTQKFYNECMSSLVLLQPRNFGVSLRILNPKSEQCTNY